MEAKRDEELLSEHLRGTHGAFDTLVTRYSGELYGFLARFVGNAAAADDLVQESFLQVYAAAGSFDPQRSFKPWLYTIAANKARDYMRSRGRRTERTLDGPAGSDGPSYSETLEHDAPETADALDEQERAARVRKLLEMMPEHLRLILTLGYYQQLPYADIAEILAIPVGTVKSRLHAAVQHFGRLWRQAQTTRTTE